MRERCHDQSLGLGQSRVAIWHWNLYLASTILMVDDESYQSSTVEMLSTYSKERYAFIILPKKHFYDLFTTTWEEREQLLTYRGNISSIAVKQKERRVVALLVIELYLEAYVYPDLPITDFET